MNSTYDDCPDYDYSGFARSSGMGRAVPSASAVQRGATNVAARARAPAGAKKVTRVKSANLKGYQAVLSGYEVVRVNGLGAVSAQTVPTNVTLAPVSDRKAVEAAVKLFASQRASSMKGLGALGVAASTAGAAKGASAGAKAGSIVPGIGTVIGAVVGALAGWLLSRNHDVRASSAQVADCRAKLTDYMQNAAQSPAQPLPLDEAVLKQYNWCVMALYGGDILLADPRFFDGDFTDLMKIARDVVRQIYNTPIGATVNLSATTNQVGKYTITTKGLSFQNPVFTDLKSFTQSPWLPIAISYCQQATQAAKDAKYRNAGMQNCGTLYSRPEFVRLLYDMIGLAARTELPNISEADLAAASNVAATMPNTSASNVVDAVSQILNKTLVKGDVSTALTGSSANAFVAPTTAASAAPPMSNLSPVPGMVGVYSNPQGQLVRADGSAIPGAVQGATPAQLTAALQSNYAANVPPIVASAVPTPLARAGVSSNTSSKIADMIAQMQAQNASQSQQYQATIDALRAQGVNTAAPQVQQAAAQQVQAASFGGGLPPWAMLGAGALALALVFTVPHGKPGKSRLRL